MSKHKPSDEDVKVATEWLVGQGFDRYTEATLDRDSLAAFRAQSRADGEAAERARVVAWLRRCALEAEVIPGPEQYEDALRDAATDIEAGLHIERGEHAKEGQQ